MTTLELTSVVVVIFGITFFLYTYFGYPAILWILRAVRGKPETSGHNEEWPVVSLTAPAFNEETQMEGLLESFLALDYPKDRLQILIVSDASTDDTDAIVKRYEEHGIELLRIEDRKGKTHAENSASPHLRGEIIVNTDASIRIAPDALKKLVRELKDPAVGLASGRDVSVAKGESTGNEGESGYVGYEMKIRDLETGVDGIVGASGCFYAIRSHLHRIPLPDFLSRDFAAALHTKENGFRAVSVYDAVCLVPRATSLRKEYRRKVRTLTRGLDTLFYKRNLLNPFRYGVFSWMLMSHKVFRWVFPWIGVATFLAVGVLALSNTVAAVVFLAGVLVLALATLGWVFSERDSVPKILSIPAFLVAGNLAAMHAMIRFLAGERDPVWTPTRRI